MSENDDATKSRQPLLTKKVEQESVAINEPKFASDNDDYQRVQDDPEPIDQPAAKPALKTNRSKAVLFTNVFAITMFIYTTLLKVTINRKGVNALDICMIRTLTMLVGCFVLVKCFNESLHV